MFKKVLIASAMLVSVVGANAIGFGVSGVINPSSCTITLSGSGLADYGTLIAATVKGYTQTFPSLYDLGDKPLNYNVACSAPTKVAFSFIDAQAGKVMTGDSNDASRYGLVNGSTGTTTIGHYELIVNTAALDGVAANASLTTVNGGSAWSLSGPTGRAANFAAPGYTVGFIKAAGTATPDAATTIAGVMNFRTRVSKALVDAATTPITLNGAGTLSLVYL